MAVGADDIALGDLDQQFRPSHEHGSTFGQPECLETRIAVVEVHLVRRQDRTAIGARHAPELAEIRQGRGLPRSNSFRLATPVASVVGMIGHALARPTLPPAATSANRLADPLSAVPGFGHDRR
jgi:hypothetical protein